MSKKKYKYFTQRPLSVTWERTMLMGKREKNPAPWGFIELGLTSDNASLWYDVLSGNIFKSYGNKGHLQIMKLDDEALSEIDAPTRF